MQETKQLKQQGFIGYILEDGIYSLVNFQSGQILSVMHEVSLLFDGTVLLKHGHPDRIDWRLEYMSEVYRIAGIPNDLHIISGKISIDELDKMLAQTGYLPKEVSMIGMV